MRLRVGVGAELCRANVIGSNPSLPDTFYRHHFLVLYEFTLIFCLLVLQIFSLAGPQKHVTAGAYCARMSSGVRIII